MKCTFFLYHDFRNLSLRASLTLWLKLHILSQCNTAPNIQHGRPLSVKELIHFQAGACGVLLDKLVLRDVAVAVRTAPVIAIPPVLRPRSFICHWHYVMLALDSIVTDNPFATCLRQ